MKGTIMNKKIIMQNGVILIIAAVVIGTVGEIRHGFNISPETTIEAIEDLTFAVIFLTGFVMRTIGKAMKEEKENE